MSAVDWPPGPRTVTARTYNYNDTDVTRKTFEVDVDGIKSCCAIWGPRHGADCEFEREDAYDNDGNYRG